MELTPTRHGVRFFVSIEVLLTFEAIEPTGLEGRPGRPEQSVFMADGERHVVTSYPVASFFLKALKATGNPLVIVAPWRTEKTASVLRTMGWSSCDEIRSVYQEPGQEKLHLSGLGCPVEEFGSAVVVATSRAAWSVSLWPQIVETVHEKGRLLSSLALLRALSTCLRIAEWRARLPHTPVSSCVALCRSQLFSRCRFFFSRNVHELTSTALAINEHGGYLVDRSEDATHLVVGDSNVYACALREPVADGLDSDEESSTHSDSTHSSVPSVVNGSGAVVNANGGGGVLVEENPSAVEEDAVDTSEDQQGDTTETDRQLPTFDADVADSIGETGDSVLASFDVAGCGQALPPIDRVESNEGTVVTVTAQWVRDCVAALFLYPPQVAHSSDDSSQWNVTMLLLATILPASCASPLSLSCFNSVAERNGFEPLQLPEASSDVDIPTALRRQWGDALSMDERDGDIFVSQARFSRDEVGGGLKEQLAFVADQFSEAWKEAVLRRRLRRSKEAGTQTSITLTATFGTNTEAIGASPPPPPQPEDSSKEQTSGSRQFFMRALGPADWAKEVYASHSEPQKPRVDELSELVELVGIAAPTGGSSMGKGTLQPQEAVENASGGGKREVANTTEQKVGGDGRDMVLLASEVEKSSATTGLPFLKCFISTEPLGAEGHALDREALLLKPPFCNFPLKLSLDKRGIYCEFPSVADANRFLENRHVEILNQLLPIVPVSAADGSANAGDAVERKRRRATSPVPGMFAGGGSVRESRRRPPPSSYSHSQRTASVKRRMPVDTSLGFTLTQKEINLLQDIGVTAEYALNNVSQLEQYAYNQLNDPVYRRRQRQLILLIEKLKMYPSGGVVA
ncbi:hypothetical protein ERJ75_000218100 [Trypanosoma vivax]|nr:repressor activator protein 1 [Trypanosoma vivax]KAH8619031.1 hypothetical protein ERJ75_000218100 [Trypanosoma vivax]